MKFIAVIILGLFLLPLIYVIPKLTSDFPLIKKPEESPTPKIIQSDSQTDIPSNTIKIDTLYEYQELTIYITEIPPKSKVNLIANFNSPRNGDDLVQQNKCDMAINGGFYTSDGKPLGLFYTDGITYSPNVTNNLTNGYFYQTGNNYPSLDFSNPNSSSSLNFIIQSGPLLYVSDKKVKLITDEPKRRSLIGADKNNRLYIITVLEKDNLLTGPYLSDIPGILNSESVQEKVPLTKILNLDGGSSSFFYVKGEKEKFILPERKFIGSLICVKI